MGRGRKKKELTYDASVLESFSPAVKRKVAIALADTSLEEADRFDQAMRAMSDAVEDEIEWVETFLKVRNKNQEIVAFKQNNTQRHLNEVVAGMRKKGKPVRAILLKARQPGVTTWSAARIFERCYRKPNSMGLVVAQKEARTRDLFEMSNRFMRCLPFMPKTEFSSRKEIVFGHEHGSVMGIETAESKDAGRGLTINYLHCSEVAIWPNATDTMTALLQAVPPNPESWVVIESTARGVGNWFHKTWKAAREGANDFTPVFIPWFWIPEYKQEIASDNEKDRLIMSLDNEEVGLRDKGATLEQLKWRRWAIANACSNDIDLFHQEFPATEDEAFLNSGRPVFNMAELSRAANRTTAPQLFGILMCEG